MRPRVLRPLVAIASVALLGAATRAADPRLEHRLGRGPTLTAVSAIVDSAANSGFETEPLIQRALEASTKAPNGNRIVQHVSRFWSAMQRARAALGPNSTPEEITAGATALQAGVDIRQLEQFRDARRGQRYAAALNTLTMMVRLGVPADTATSVVAKLVLASATDEQLSSLYAEIERDVLAGTPAGVATTARGDGLERILQQGDNSGVPGAALPSARGTTRSADPTARPLGGSAVGNTAPGTGPRPPAPRGKDNKRP